MKKKSKIAPVILIVSVFAVTTCRKEPETPGPSKDIPLTVAQDAFLAAVKDTIIRLEDMILTDGRNVRSFLEQYDPEFLIRYPSGSKNGAAELTPFEQKNLFIARMLGAGNYLVEDALHRYDSLSTDKPAQKGLAYLWGGKDFVNRHIPYQGTGECENLMLYGLDCTGMLWSMVKAAGLPPVEPENNFFTATIRDVSKWTTAFKASAEFKDLVMRDTGKQIPPDMMEEGDIILWESHVGVYLNGYVYQSNGTSLSTDCRRNMLPDRGPRLISADQIAAWGLGDYEVFRTNYFGHSYHIIVDYDVVNDDGGVCVEASYHDVAEFDIEITNLPDSPYGVYSLANQGKIKNSGPAGVRYTGGSTDFDSCRCNVISVTDEFTVTGLDTLVDHWVDLAKKEYEIAIRGTTTNPPLRFTCGSATDWYDTDSSKYNWRHRLPPIPLSEQTEVVFDRSDPAITWKVTAIRR
jgi:hypothetical protein